MKKTEKANVGFLVKVFIKNHDNINDGNVREKCGSLSSYVGIATNFILFVTKIIVGTLAGSVAIAGDAFNNLSDAGSSIISLFSFKMSTKPADKNHPFGHARIEYISSSLVAVVILFIGFELLKSSIEKILNPIAITFSAIMVIVLVVSIILKLWLYYFNKRLGAYIDSILMEATAADSLSDVLATSAVLLSIIISYFTGVNLDGYMGVIVSAFIMYSGIKVLKETINNIMGRAPSKELINKIESFIQGYEGVMGIHDLVVHDYGPQHCFASLHVEVDANADILESHDLIDNIERDMLIDHGIHLVIHLDPIVTDDPFVKEMKDLTKKIVSEIDRSLSIHDFRIVKGKAHKNLIFDVLMTEQCKLNEKTIQDEIIKRIKEIDMELYAVITIDRSFVSTPSKKLIK